MFARVGGSLSDLVPNYLPAVPMDPFADNAPLRYIRTGTHFVLYSIGPDGADNGGTPIENQTDDQGNPVSGPKKYYIYSESHGDIVAGINIS